MARRSAVGLKKRMGSEAPHETVLWVPKRSAVSGSWSLGKPEKAGAVLAGGTSQKNYKKAQIRRGAPSALWCCVKTVAAIRTIAGAIFNLKNREA